MLADGAEMFTQEFSASDVSLCSRLEAEAGVPEISPSLPADFRVQVHMLYWMGDQRRLLERMLELQVQIESQIQGLKRDVAIGQSAAERMERKVNDLHEGKLWNNGAHWNANANWQNHRSMDDECPAASAKKMDDDCDQCFGTANLHLEYNESNDHDFITGRHRPFDVDLGQKDSSCAKKLPADGSCPAPIEEDCVGLACRAHPLKRQNAMTSRPKISQSYYHAFLYGVVSSSPFDFLCGCVIMANAIWAGIVAQNNIEHALSHAGEGSPATTDFAKNVNRCFFIFYFTELLLRLVAFRKKFFTNPSTRSWNIFDMGLVIVGAYDIVVELTGVKPMNLTAVRLLRLAKMVKMLRVVRVLRMFKQMRTMLNSLTQSLILLIWAILVLAVILYVFGLCFLFSVTGYLHETPRNLISDETGKNIDSYWKSVPVVIVSLFMTLTGGADWESISQPIKTVGGIYYIIFLLYVAFGVITVMNVLTGLIVDNSMKAAIDDEHDVVAAIFEQESRAVSALVDLYNDDPEFQVHRTMCWMPFEKDLKLKNGVAHKFLKVFEIKAMDALRVFSLLSHSGKNGRVMIDAFITGCSKARSSALGVELFSLSYDTAIIQKHLEVLMQSFKQCSQIGAMPSIRSNFSVHPDPIF